MKKVTFNSVAVLDAGTLVEFAFLEKLYNFNIIISSCDYANVKTTAFADKSFQ